jgi:DNA polymerase-3 subunit epsilon
MVTLDTETTGLDVAIDRIVEIACVETLDGAPTGREYHAYVNPCCEVPAEAFDVHGLSTDFLARAPAFAEILPGLLDFVRGRGLVIHNAAFDLAFLQAECERAGAAWPEDIVVVDSLAAARKRFPGAPASLDALCRRFGIDLSVRKAGHGALVDCRLLARVQFELDGGAQRGLDLAGSRGETALGNAGSRRRTRPPVLVHVSAAEGEAHARAMAKVKGALWGDILGRAARAGAGEPGDAATAAAPAMKP